MEIFYLPTSQKQLKRLPKNQQIKVLRIIDRLSADPDTGKSLKGKLSGLHSAKAWPYRIIYRFIKGKIIIETIQHRQGAYK